MRDSQILYTYLHLAPEPELTDVLLERKVTGVAYETITDAKRHAAAPDADERSRGAHGDPGRRVRSCEAPSGGRGVLLGGVPGVPPGRRRHPRRRRRRHERGEDGGRPGRATSRCSTWLDRLRELDDIFGGRIEDAVVEPATRSTNRARGADLLIGAVLVPGAAAPKLVTREMIAEMETGSVLVDVAIDQGGLLRDVASDDARRSDLRRSTAWCTTASPTCRAPCRAPRPSR